MNVPTHRYGNFLDLCFASRDLTIGDDAASVQNNLDVTSDHLPLLINTPFQCNVSPSSFSYRLSTISFEKFLYLLQTHLTNLTLLSEKSREVLENGADELTRIFLKYFSGSAKQ